MKNMIKLLLPNLLHLLYRYYFFHGTYPNLFNPKRFNEKIALRMFKPKKKYSVLANKIDVRTYVKERIGESYLIPMLWEGEKLTQDDWINFPASFVLKANHASGTNLIVRDKKEYLFADVLLLTNEWLKMDFSKVNLEKHYKGIKPKLMVEKLLISDDGRIPYDYKVHCFNSSTGTEFFIQVDYDRFENNGDAHTRDFFDKDWNFVPFTLDFNNASVPATKPKNLNELLKLSKKLSEGLAYARVDWYIVNEKPLFGEITLTHGCAGEKFTPEKYDLIWGLLWDNDYEKEYSKKIDIEKVS